MMPSSLVRTMAARILVEEAPDILLPDALRAKMDTEGAAPWSPLSA